MKKQIITINIKKENNDKLNEIKKNIGINKSLIVDKILDKLDKKEILDILLKG